MLDGDGGLERQRASAACDRHTHRERPTVPRNKCAEMHQKMCSIKYMIAFYIHDARKLNGLCGAGV